MSPNNTSSSQSHDPQDEIDLRQLAGTIWYYKWRIGWFTALTTTIGVIYALTSTPIYQADAMLEITNTKNQVLGELSDLLGGSQYTPIDTEMELIKSRLILGKSARDLGLDVSFQPQTNRWSKLFGQSDIPIDVQIGEFHVDVSKLNHTFTFVVTGKNSFNIITPEKKTYSGVVGQHLTLGNPNTRIIITKMSAPFGQTFSLTKYTELASIQKLRSSLSVSAKGKNVPIVNLSMTGTDPQAIQNALNRIIANYTEHNRNKDVQTAINGLKFINEELPRLEDKLREAENNLNTYRAKSGSLDVPNEARGTLESLNKIEMQMVDLRTEESVLSEVYTTEHPAYKALNDKIKVLEQAKDRLNRQISRMPETQQAIIRLTRDVEINQAIYVQLLNKRQELSILSASSQGNVRLIDAAVTAEKPIKPKKAIIVALAFVVGLMVSVLAALLSSLLRRGIASEEEIEALGLEVWSSVPLSETQSKRDKVFKRVSKHKHARTNTILALEEPTDISIEALRALRTSLHFRALGQDNKVVMVSGATPEVGKSFVSANLAVLMAQAGRKVLLIDADLRKGYLHTMMRTPEKNLGFSDILLSDKKKYDDMIQKTDMAGLSFVSVGSTAQRNPAELLTGNKLPEFLRWANKHYDHVVLDTPPILLVTDAAVIGQYVGTSLLVSRFGQTDLRELSTCISRFDVNKVKINGVILNGIERTASNYHGYYNKYTKYTKDNKDN